MDKELLQQAFEAGREDISHPDFDYIYENFDDWFKGIEPTLAKTLQEKHDQKKQLIELVERILLSFNYKHGETKCSTCMTVDEYESVRDKLLYLKTSPAFADREDELERDKWIISYVLGYQSATHKINVPEVAQKAAEAYKNREQKTT